MKPVEAWAIVSPVGNILWASSSCGDENTAWAIWQQTQPGYTTRESVEELGYRCERVVVGPVQSNAASEDNIVDESRSTFESARKGSAAIAPSVDHASLSDAAPRSREELANELMRAWNEVADECTHGAPNSSMLLRAGCVMREVAAALRARPAEALLSSGNPPQLPSLTDAMYHAARGLEYTFSSGGSDSVVGYLNDDCLDEIWDNINTALRVQWQAANGIDAHLKESE